MGRSLGPNCPKLSRSRKKNGKVIVSGSGSILRPRDRSLIRAPRVGRHGIKRTVRPPPPLVPIKSCTTRARAAKKTTTPR